MQSLIYRRFFVSIIFLIVFYTPKAQDLDSLRNNRTVESYLKLGNFLANKFGYTDSLLHYANKALALAKVKNDKSGEVKGTFNLALYLQRINQFDSSTRVLRSIQSSKELQGEVELQMGINFYRQNNNKQAQEHYLKAIEVFERNKDREGKGLTYCKMAALFINEGQTEKVLKYTHEAIGMLPEIKDPFSRISVLSSFSGIYSILANTNKEFLDTSVMYAKQALELVNQHQYFTKGNQLINTLSNIYFSKGDFSKSLEYGHQALTFKKYLLPSEIVITFLNLSDCYASLKNYKMCLTYLDSVRYVTSNLDDPYYRLKLFEREYAYNKDAGNTAIALKALERYSALEDSLFSVDRSKVINELEEKYNRSENEKRIETLNKQNEIASLNVRILIIGVVAAILAIAVIVFINRQIALKNKFKILETEQRLNRARMDPHFFFNALSSLQTLAIDKENNAKVVQLISKFSKVMRQSLESSYNELVTIERELEFLDNYLEVQKIRFPDKFDHKITCDDNLEVSELKIPSMLLQPFLENSIEHGFKNIGYKGMITISIIKKDSNVLVQISDNGVGFDTEKMKKEYPSRATQIITDRIELLNQSHGSKASFSITKNHPKGVCVEVTLPCIY